MSCLRLRLPPARRAWKSFTSKLQSKLHKPKGITKPRNRVKAITAAAASSSSSSSSSSACASVRLRPYKFLQLRFKRRRRLALHFRYNCPQLLQNRSTAHVYADKLFKEPAVTEPVERSQPPVQKCKQAAAAAATTATGSGGERACATADDMWESLGFASPLMHGIDERAEEFIARFRKEMEVQEKLARDHL